MLVGNFCNGLKESDTCLASIFHRDEWLTFEIALSIMYLGDCLLDAKLWTEKLDYPFQKLLCSDNSKSYLRGHLNVRLPNQKPMKGLILNFL